MRSNNELNHSLKGSMRAGHKYLTRTMKNGKWVYKYAKKKASDAASKVAKGAEDIRRQLSPSEQRGEELAKIMTDGPGTTNQINKLTTVTYRDVDDMPKNRIRSIADTALTKADKITEENKKKERLAQVGKETAEKVKKLLSKKKE